MRTYLAGAALVLGLIGARPAAAQGDLAVSFTTTEHGGPYAPRNIVAVWIEDAGGTFVKTIGRWANVRRQHLVAWAAASGQDADAVSGATRVDHTGTLMVTWDLTNRAGAVVADGTYTIRMELADANSTTPAQNNQGTFTFTKGPNSSSETTSGGGFDNVAIDYTTASLTCNDGTLDPGETCDPPGSCPTSCAASADACMPSRLVGSAAGCTAECVVEAITACADGDGCCPGGCDAASDADCGSDPQPVTGGCAAAGGDGGGPVLLVAGALAVGLLGRRRRPRR
jgi:uncharacterized protein (TIGR03382 family)